MIEAQRTATIEAEDLRRRLAGLEHVGAIPGHGVTRLAWTPEDAACRAWFEQQAAAAGLRFRRDLAGNLWACPPSDPPWWGVGSHLDSVRGGGRFDGPLGVAAGFAVAACASRPVAVLAFADEEGARYNTPTFGSRALTGRLDVDDALRRVDADGVSLEAAIGRAGLDARRLGQASDALAQLHGFLELHIDQSTVVAGMGRPAAVVDRLAARTRLHVGLDGVADHAGTTPREERRDAMSCAARLIVVAEQLATDEPRAVVTATRLLVEPNAFSTIPAHVDLWLDARMPETRALETWRADLKQAVAGLAERTGVRIETTVLSRSPSTEFDVVVRGRLQAAAEARGCAGPEITCFAGHDAGMLAPCVPAGMVLVRNRAGISHAPEEHIELDDAAVGATMILRALEATP